LQEDFFFWKGFSNTEIFLLFFFFFSSFCFFVERNPSLPSLLFLQILKPIKETEKRKMKTTKKEFFIQEKKRKKVKNKRE
jgi:hypothetical protein